MRTAIVLPVSRSQNLDNIFARLEMLDADSQTTDLIVSVHGDKALYDNVKHRVDDSRYDYRLTVAYNPRKRTKREFSASYRRQDIANIHNMLRTLVRPDIKYVFGIEDDTVVTGNSLSRLKLLAGRSSNAGIVSGVQVGRWGIPYIGAWKADDVYEPSLLTTVDDYKNNTTEAVDATGLYCFLVRADLYRNHEFKPFQSVLGADVDFGLSLRQQGFQNYIDWQLPCGHITKTGEILYPNKEMKVVQYEKRKDKWRLNTL